jgi:hypothetical protein
VLVRASHRKSTMKGRVEKFRASATDCDRLAKDTQHPRIADAFRFLARRWREIAAQVESFSEEFGSRFIEDAAPTLGQGASIPIGAGYETPLPERRLPDSASGRTRSRGSNC